MSASAEDVSRLVALIGAARAHADGMGVDSGPTTGLLDQALVAARAIAARGGKPDEGLRPEELNTDNDGGVS